MNRRAKIVCTLGPATHSYERVRALVYAGMDVARLNFSHGSYDDHKQAYTWVREASDESGEVCAAYGVLVPRQHVALRGLFIIDPNGVLQYQVIHNLSVGRRTEEVLRVLDALQTGGLCPENWTPADTTIDPASTLTKIKGGISDALVSKGLIP